jgi:hypothetical protein
MHDEGGNAYNILVVGPERKGPFVKPKRRWAVKLKLIIRKLDTCGLD